MRPNLRTLVPSVVLLITVAIGTGLAQDKGAKLRFGVGPLQPTPTETKKAYEPFFAYVAKQLGRDFDLVATTDWAGISVALAHGQVDVAWMGRGATSSPTTTPVCARSRPPSTTASRSITRSWCAGRAR
jgi:phosphonate transport system substrate-binding protein